MGSDLLNQPRLDVINGSIPVDDDPFWAGHRINIGDETPSGGQVVDQARHANQKEEEHKDNVEHDQRVDGHQLHGPRRAKRRAGRCEFSTRSGRFAHHYVAP